MNILLYVQYFIVCAMMGYFSKPQGKSVAAAVALPTGNNLSLFSWPHGVRNRS